MAQPVATGRVSVLPMVRPGSVVGEAQAAPGVSSLPRRPQAGLADDETAVSRGPLVHNASVEFVLRGINVGAIALGIDERIHRVLRGGACDELAIPAPRSSTGG